jgi:hypothetical protein
VRPNPSGSPGSQRRRDRARLFRSTAPPPFVPTASLWLVLTLVGAMLLTASWAASLPPTGSNPTAGSSPGPFSLAGGPAANLSVAPGTGFVHDPVNATGSGYAPNTAITLTFGASTVSGCLVGSEQSDGNGNFSCVFYVPVLAAGTYGVNATDGVVTGSTNFTILLPTLTLVPTTGYVGSVVTATGGGYNISTLLSGTFRGLAITHCTSSGSLTTNSSGNLTCGFKVPTVTAGSVSVSFSDGVNSATALFTVKSPTLLLTPSSGAVGSSVVATGVGYKPSHPLTFAFGGVPFTSSNCSAGSLTTSASGGLNCTFPVPFVAGGAYSVLASDPNNSASAIFTVGAPTLTATPHFGTVGSTVTASGSGFELSTTLSLNYSTSTITSCTSGSLTTGSGGDFTCAFPVPASVSGLHVLNASDRLGYATATYTVDPRITLSTSSGTVGTSVTVTGTGFDGTTGYTVTWDTGPAVCTGGSTDALGDLSCSFKIPAATTGAHTVTAAELSNTAAADFTVDALAVVTPTYGPVGTAITVLGSGLPGSTSATVTWDGSTTLCTLTTNASGGADCSSRVPAAPLGSNTITVTAGSSTPTVIFDVNSTFTLSVSQGIVGTSVTLTGSGFDASTTYRDCFESTETGCGPGMSFTTDPSGNIPSDTALAVPSVAPGDYFVDVSLGNAYATSAPFTVTSASLQLTPSSGPVGTSIGVTGSGFNPSQLYSFCFQLSGAACPAGAPATFTSTPTGEIPAGVTISAPPSPSRSYYVDVSQGTTLVSLAPFVIIANLVLSPDTGVVSEDVAANGTGLLASSPYVVMWNATSQFCAGTTDANGSFGCVSPVPPTPVGIDEVTATDGTNSPTGNFTVESNLAVTPAQGTVGTSLTFTGTGLSASTGYALRWNSSATSCVGVTDAQGSFSCALALPPSPHGVVPVTVTAGASSASVQVAVLASLDLSLATGAAGAPITATGEGFAASVPYTLTWNSTITLCSATTSASGGFSCGFDVPTAPGGVHILSATDGTNVATASFTLVPALVISATLGPVGASETVTGTGFDASAPYTLTWDTGTLLCSGDTDSNGEFDCGFSVPSSPAGTHSIVATEGSYLPGITFTVTSSLSLSPTQGPVGTAVRASGAGFGATLPYTVEWNGGTTLCTGTTSAEGAFSCTLTIPSEPSGVGTISGIQGSNQAGTTFLVTAAFALSVSAGTVGSMVNVTGNGFADSTSYQVMWNSSATVCEGVTNATGAFVCAYEVPPAVAGVHLVSAIQGVTTVGEAFTVVPNVVLSPAGGAVGTTVTISGTGFDAQSRYDVLWNSSISPLCSGSTDTNGGFTCTFVVPPSAAGSTTVTISEGGHAPTATFTVSAVTPSTGGSGSFPWWEVVAVVVSVIAVLLVIGLVYERRRHRGPRPVHPRSPPTPQPWSEGPTPSPTAASAPLSPFVDYASVTGVESATAPASASTGAEPDPEDIDQLIARLERMSVAMFKKKPKELGDSSSVGEEIEPAAKE